MKCQSPTLMGKTLLLIGLFLAPMAVMAEEPMILRFAWPDNLSGRVTLTLRYTDRRNSGRTTEWEGHGSARFSVSPAAGDLLITFEDSVVDIVTNTNDGLGRPLSDIIMSRSLRRPNYRISRDGAFLGLDRPVEFLQSARSDIETMITKIPPDMREILLPVIDNAMSREQFEYYVGNRWREEVAHWVDREIGPGSPNAVDETIDLLIGKDHAAPGRVSYRLVRRVPCGPGGPGGPGGDETCVELERRATADPAAATAAYERLALGHGDQIAIGQFEFATTTRLVTDPDTLLPFQVSFKWVETIDPGRNRPSDSNIRTGVATVTYHYD